MGLEKDGVFLEEVEDVKEEVKRFLEDMQLCGI